MWLPPESWAAATALVGVFMVLSVYATVLWPASTGNSAIFLAVAWSSFLTSQMSLVRADTVHAKTVLEFAVLSIIISLGIAKTSAIRIVWLIGAGMAGLLLITSDDSTRPSIANQWCAGWQLAIFNFTGIRAYEASETELRSAAVAPGQDKLRGKSFDILGNQQSIAESIGNEYHPRPIFQSYSAYTPALAQKNDIFFAKTPPDIALLGFATIDSRMLAMEDGPSLFRLVCTWQLAGEAGEFLVFQRPAIQKPFLFDEKHSVANVASWSYLDAAPGVYFIRFPEFGKLFGQKMRLVSRPHGILICKYSDGTEQTFHMTPGIAEAGFIISPRIVSFRDIIVLRQAPSQAVVCTKFSVAVAEQPASKEIPFSLRRSQPVTGNSELNFFPLEKLLSGDAPLNLRSWQRDGTVYVADSTVSFSLPLDPLVISGILYAHPHDDKPEETGQVVFKNLNAVAYKAEKLRPGVPTPFQFILPSGAAARLSLAVSGADIFICNVTIKQTDRALPKSTLPKK